MGHGPEGKGAWQAEQISLPLWLEVLPAIIPIFLEESATNIHGEDRIQSKMAKEKTEKLEYVPPS